MHLIYMKISTERVTFEGRENILFSDDTMSKTEGDITCMARAAENIFSSNVIEIT